MIAGRGFDVDEQQRARVIAASPLLAGVPADDVRTLATAATVRRYRRGQLLFCEGDPGDSMLVVVEGTLKAFHTSPHGDELLLAVVEPPETLGELTVADGGARSLSVSALTSAVVLRIPRDTLLEVAARSPAFTGALLVALADVVRRLTGAAADLVFLDIPRRVAKFLLTLRGPEETDIVRTRLTQTDMADRIGASRQSLNAALQEFQRRGWITVGQREITISDPSALRRFVGE
jgi:CRP/FNR family transcriptional regulator, cyclic AMP receptor protein